MPLQFKDILASIGMRHWEKKDDALIDFLSRRIQKTGQSGHAGLGKEARQLTGKGGQFQAGQSNNANATTTWRSRNGGYGVSWLFACHPRSDA